MQEPLPNRDPTSAAAPGMPVEERELPTVSKLLSDSFKDLQDNFGGYCLVGLPALVVALSMSMVAVGGMIALMIPMMASGAGEDTFALFLFGGMGALVFGSILVTVPLNAGLGRAVWAHITGKGELTFSAPLALMKQDLGSVFLVQFVITVLSIVGMLFFFFPTLIVAVFCSFALPAVLVHRVGAFEAISISANHARSHFWWHFKVWGLGTLVFMALSQVPILGVLLAGPWMFSFTLRAYRAVFGDKETLPLS